MSGPSAILRVFVDAPELLSDVVATVDPSESIEADLVDSVFDAKPGDAAALLLVAKVPPAIDTLVALGRKNRSSGPLTLVCAIEPDRSHRLGPQLGVPMFESVGAALAAARFVRATRSLEALASPRGLGAADRIRLSALSDRGPRLVRLDGGLLGLAIAKGAAKLGRIDDVAVALEGLARTSRTDPPSLPRVEGVDRSMSLDVLVGPARTLSDPASKAALEPYDLPLPTEELCATASRAAAESQRIGFPVRIALASPELRPSRHPELVVEGIEGAAKVRDAFRELVALAERTNPSARILGVTVGASTAARCLVRITLLRIAKSHLVATCGFADPHGRASGDSVDIVLPSAPESIRSALRTLRAASLLRDEAAEDGRVETQLIDIVLRASAFLDDFAEEVDRVSLDPIAVLHGGDVEIREAYVGVTDAFTRRLERHP